ncbi:MAG: type II secretion system protein GspK [Burkholderiaceae bacterium]|nr:type II secretion system protein GspK [Burkholderiaceae bacterium]
MTRLQTTRTCHRGVALVAVLWMVAALSIMVVGMSYGVRGETRKASLARQGIALGALGNAAIALVLQEMVSSPERTTHLSYRDVTYKDLSIRVEILPINGLIDINNASESLLAKLFSIRGGLDIERAKNLAQKTIDIRSQKDLSGQTRGFESVEDWLKVPGIDYSLYARMKDLVTANLFGVGSGRVNPLAAPREVLTILTGGNVEHSSRIASDRDSDRAGIDTTMLDASDVEAAPTNRFRISARVTASTNTPLWITQTVDITASKRDGLTWRIFNVERRFESARPERLN